MPDALIFALLLLAVILGFWLGWRFARRNRRNAEGEYPWGYYKGLAYLFNEQADSAVDAFIDALEVNPETLETHLALGNLLRRKGEVAKAIKIHQNLLARPSLTLPQLHEAQLELARDYIKAGLLDRAELLLQELVESSQRYKDEALTHLMEIYQDEKEWLKALDVADQLSSKRKSKHWDSRPRVTIGLAVARAHYCCEIAQLHMERNDLLNARRYLQDALSYDRSCVRASLLWAQLEYSQGDYREALKLLQRIPHQNPDFTVDSLALVSDCYHQLGDHAGLSQYLLSLLEEQPLGSLVIKYAEELRRSRGDPAAIEFLTEQFRRKPSVKTLNRLLELHLQRAEGKGRENLLLLKQLAERIMAEHPSYRCEKCGFAGSQLHWLCPSCKSWSRIKAIRGIEGE